MAKAPSEAKPPGVMVSRRLPKAFSFKVVGVMFVEGYPDNATRLKETAERRWLLAPGNVWGAGTGPEPEPLPAILIHDPDNPVDRWAVEVHTPEVGKVGMVPAQGHARLAERLGRELAAGVLWQAEIDEVAIHPEHPDRPGIQVQVRRIEGLDGEAASG